MKLFKATPNRIPAIIFWVFYAFCVLLVLVKSADARAIERDKALHMGAGCAVAVVAVSLMDESYTPKEKFVTAVAITSIVGLAKELNDRGKKRHTYDVMDALATSAGSMVCAKISINF